MLRERVFAIGCRRAGSMGDPPSSAAFSNDSKRSANEFITVASRVLKGRYVLESVGSLSAVVTSPVEEYKRTL